MPQEKSNALTFEVQKFNVLCVTKKTKEGDGSFHQPITGVAEVQIYITEEFGVKIAVTSVHFGGQYNKLRYVRTGLNGGAVVIAVERKDGPYDVWELYTDTPTGSKSAQELWEMARYESEKHW